MQARRASVGLAATTVKGPENPLGGQMLVLQMAKPMHAMMMFRCAPALQITVKIIYALL